MSGAERGRRRGGCAGVVAVCGGGDGEGQGVGEGGGWSAGDGREEEGQRGDQ